MVYGGFAEDPVREGYPKVKPYVRNVHVKDADQVASATSDSAP